jgi:hypothetical protein
MADTSIPMTIKSRRSSRHSTFTSWPFPRPSLRRVVSIQRRQFRGDELFSGKAKCNNGHVDPLWTDPGRNLHKHEEIWIEVSQATALPITGYRTSPGDLFMQFKGGFYHDARIQNWTVLSSITAAVWH